MKTINSETLLGQGLYSQSEAAKILHVPTRTLQRWLAEQTSAQNDNQDISVPLVYAEIKDLDGEIVLSFRNLVELLFISLFRKVGVSLQTIRLAAQEAARIFGNQHPFAVQQFETDGKHIFATLNEQTLNYITSINLVQDLNLSQMVMDVLARPYFKKIEYTELGASRYWPLGQDRSVVLDPHRAYGKPIDEQSGVPTLVLYQMARSGEPVKSIASWYGTTEDAVSAAIEFESSLQKAA